MNIKLFVRLLIIVGSFSSGWYFYGYSSVKEYAQVQSQTPAVTPSPLQVVSTVTPSSKKTAEGVVVFGEKSINNTKPVNLLDKNWGEVGTVDASVLRNMADVDAILSLQVPQPNADKVAFIKFEQQLQNIKLGRRYSNHDYTTPLLTWYAYIAKYSPETIYYLFSLGKLGNRKFSHLISYGFLPTWPEYIEDPYKLLMTSRSALLSVAVSYSDDVAKDTFIHYFLKGKPGDRRRIQLENFLYSIDRMSEAQVLQAKNLFLSHQRSIDSRNVLSLYHDGRLKLSKHEALTLIEMNKYNHADRSMSSYFVDAVALGGDEYFRFLLEDIADNANQPSNFYCAACGLALFGEGLIGKTLIDKISREEDVSITATHNLFIISGEQE